MLKDLYIVITDNHGNTPISFKVDLDNKRELDTLLNEPYLLKRLLQDAEIVNNNDFTEPSNKKSKGRTVKK
jgi:hypothetical protein